MHDTSIIMNLFNSINKPTPTEKNKMTNQQHYELQATNLICKRYKNEQEETKENEDNMFNHYHFNMEAEYEDNIFIDYVCYKFGIEEVLSDLFDIAFPHNFEYFVANRNNTLADKIYCPHVITNTIEQKIERQFLFSLSHVYTIIRRCEQKDPETTKKSIANQWNKLLDETIETDKQNFHQSRLFFFRAYLVIYVSFMIYVSNGCESFEKLEQFYFSK